MKMRVWVTGLLLTGSVVVESGAADYREQYRPQFHFTPAVNWMNDPNGMVYFGGEWHLFYQYNPFGDKWGHMSWGHAVSENLVHWEHLPVALPEADGVMIFSGSAVVDTKNTSGFGEAGGEPPLVAIYTGHHTTQKRQDQRIAYSLDRGRTWTKWAENPVLDIRKADFRDPKVFWDEAAGRWVMVVTHPVDRQVGFYGSPDLKHWRPLGEFGPAGSTTGIWECPDLFPLPVEGSDTEKWVLVVNVGGGAPAGGSGCQYFVGEWDGWTFVPDARTHPGLAVKAEDAAPEGRVLADFEDGFGDWEVEGEAFGKGPAGGPVGGQMAVDGYLGEGFANSFHGGDATTGTLTSGAFEVTHDALQFLVGGGAIGGETCLELLLGDEVVRTATGEEAERLTWRAWDVADLRGKRVRLRAADRATGSWGHVNVDHVVLTDAPTVDAGGRRRGGGALWADWGRDFYAAVSWSDVPAEDGRRVWIGWMSNWQYAQDVPTSPWRSAMSVPRTLTLRDTGEEGFRLLQAPVVELEGLREATEVFGGGTVAALDAWLKAKGSGELLDAEVVLSGSGDAGLRIGGAGGEVVWVRAVGDELRVDRRASGAVEFHAQFPGEYTAPLRRNEGGRVSLRVLADVSSVEVFANGGESVVTSLVFPEAGAWSLGIEGENVRVESARVSRLRGSWGTADGR